MVKRKKNSLKQKYLRSRKQIRRKDGSVFILKSKRNKTGSPFDVSVVKPNIATDEILDAVRDSRQR